MNSPSKEELETALDAARRMREFGVDPHHLAHSLLYMNERNEALGNLLQRVDRYVRFGLPETELTKLRRQIQTLREEEPVLESEYPSSVML